MSCAACKGEMINRMGDIDLRINGTLYIIHNVHFEECSNCGEKILDPETSETIYERIQQKKYTKEKIEIPMMDLAVNM